MKITSLIEKAFLIKKLPLFTELELNDLLAIADKLECHDYSVGEEIFHIGQLAHRMYILAQGTIQVQNEDKGVIDLLKAPNFFGDQALFSDKERNYEAVTTSQCLIYSISKTNLLSIIAEFPSVALGFLSAYAKKSVLREPCS